MASDQRIAIAQDFFQRFMHGDVSSALELLDEGVSYHVSGSHQASGRFEGREAVTKHLAQVLDITNRTVDVLQWEDWMAGVNHVSALVQMSAQRPGAVYRFRAVFLFSLNSASTITHIEMFFSDQDAADRFFRRVAD